jgi:SHS2 domain-containing protein
MMTSTETPRSVPTEASWEHFPHGADIGVRGIGATKAAAFVQAARAMTAAMVDLDRVEAREAVDVACRAPDDGLLLMDWLNALIYEMATRRMLFSDFTVTIEGHDLRGRALGEAIDIARHEPAVEVKGATVTCLAVEQRGDGSWLAQCVIDV